MNTQIIILAAGKGTRMESDEPKALAPLHGKPFLQHILDTVKKLNIKAKPIIVVGHKKERIFDVFGPEERYVIQEEQLGTGHAVRSAKKSLNNNEDIIIVLSTDQPLVSIETIEGIIATHSSKNPKITIGTVLLPDFEDWRSGLSHFGRIVRDSNGRVIKNIEYKDASGDERLITEVNPALYAFNAPWLWKNIELLKNENSQGEYYLTDLIRMASENGESIEAVPVANILEGLQPNSKAELELLEKLA